MNEWMYRREDQRVKRFILRLHAWVAITPRYKRLQLESSHAPPVRPPEPNSKPMTRKEVERSLRRRSFRGACDDDDDSDESDDDDENEEEEMEEVVAEE